MKKVLGKGIDALIPENIKPLEEITEPSIVKDYDGFWYFLMVVCFSLGCGCFGLVLGYYL